MVAGRRLGLLSFARLQAVLFALLGLFAGLLYALGGLVVDVLVSVGWIAFPSTTGVGGGTALAFLAVIGMPLLLGTGGFVIGMLEAALYNVALRWWSGVGTEP